MKILIAEDEKSIANSLKKNFQEEGHEPTIALDGQQALELVSQENFDVILLDWRMPKKSGIEVCDILRTSGFSKPILLLTALSDISNKIEALNLGADDYITKPFSFDEVMARILAIQRRYNSLSRTVVFDDIELNLFTRILTINDEKIKLSEKEFDLLKYFIDNKGQILDKERLCRDVWELPFTPETNIVEVTIKNLRKKLEEDTDKKFIRTIYGEGYLFISD
jgi:DNA-binding response OmpR family regulator